MIEQALRGSTPREMTRTFEPGDLELFAQSRIRMNCAHQLRQLFHVVDPTLQSRIAGNFDERGLIADNHRTAAVHGFERR